MKQQTFILVSFVNIFLSLCAFPFQCSPLLSASILLFHFSDSIQFHRDYRWGQKHAAHSSVIKLHVKHISLWISGREKYCVSIPRFLFTTVKGLRHWKSLEWIKYEDNKTCASAAVKLQKFGSKIDWNIKSQKGRGENLATRHKWNWDFFLLHNSRVGDYNSWMCTNNKRRT